MCKVYPSERGRYGFSVSLVGRKGWLRQSTPRLTGPFALLPLQRLSLNDAFRSLARWPLQMSSRRKSTLSDPTLELEMYVHSV